GMVPEPGLAEGRLAFWITGSRDARFVNWERIANVPRAPIEAAGGICSTAASAIRARQRLEGFLGKLLQPFRKPGIGPSWILPSGESADQWGEVQTDWLLVWPENETAPLDETQVRSRWPQSNQVRKLAGNLYAVQGIAAPRAGTETIQR